MKSNRIIAVTIICLVLSVLGHSTAAYYNKSATARNVITSGSIDINLVETTISGETWQDVKNIMPGDTVSKIVTVNNNDKDAFIRIKCNLKVNDVQGNILNDDNIEIDFNTEEWTLKDGWWYYNKPLLTGENTVPLFTQVSFSENMGNQFKNSNIVIDVKAQATQVDNNGANVFEAVGWPTN